MKGNILIIGDATEVKLLRDALKERGLAVCYHPGLEDLKKEELKKCDVLVYQLKPGEDKATKFLEKIEKVKKESTFNFIVLAEESSVESAVYFIKRGAFDFKLLSTPLDLLEKTVLFALEEKRIFWEEDTFLTRNPKLLKILEKLKGVAQSNVPVLLVGESGTGKELLSRFIHKHSPRKNGPFVAINCAALPESLLESELFGYEKGAFSGATYQKKGKIEIADGGTLLLDEITEMHPNLQSKLLRVLQEGEVDRLGGYHPIKVDVRIISTTNRNIEKEVKEGRFRADLYYRINVITVKIPPLRERKEDIEFLAKHFLERFSHAYHKKIKGFTEEAKKFLLNYNFPGNVRELKNMIERAVLTCQEEFISVKDLTDPFSFDEPSCESSGTDFDSNFIESEIKPLEVLEREAILKALKACQGNKTKAAELLGITVRTLRNKLKLYREQGLLPEEV